MSSFETVEENIKEDFLEVDSKIPGQNFVCLSFISPEKVLKQKEVYFTTKFLEHLFNGEDKYTLDMKEKMMNDKTKINYDNIKSFYEDWKYSRNEVLDKEFHEINDFRTTTRGLKVRGTYDSYKEATIRAQALQKKDKNFHVFVAQVGYWLPWDPDSDQVQDQEYQEQMLNDLVKKYNENRENSDVIYDQMKEEQIKKAKEELRMRKEKLAEENNEKVVESNEEDKKKIEELRDIVDESDKLYYESMKKASNEQKNNLNNEIKISEVETENNNEIKNGESIPEDIKNNLESEDPWLKSKNL